MSELISTKNSSSRLAYGPEDDDPPHPDEGYWIDEDDFLELVESMFADERLPIGDVFKHQ